MSELGGLAVRTGGGVLDAAGGGAPASGAEAGDLHARRGGEETSPLERASDALSSLTERAVETPAVGGGRVERLVAEGPLRTPEAEAADREGAMSFGEMMAGYRDVTRVTVELGVVASASSSCVNAVGKLMSGS